MLTIPSWLLVYEYVNNGNLEQWLHGAMQQYDFLTWDARIKILLGTTKAYNYNSSAGLLARRLTSRHWRLPFPSSKHETNEREHGGVERDDEVYYETYTISLQSIDGRCKVRKKIDVPEGCAPGGIFHNVFLISVSSTKWTIEHEEPVGNVFKANHPEALVFIDNCNVIFRVIMEKCGNVETVSQRSKLQNWPLQVDLHIIKVRG
ncbi:unnamed protein product [Trifolium pratense]|uniref:Uncharacterized protein n=1 Tax=Trifolium pratense TaxID=57577 RepID=A0ACB0KJE1_TRIPR|nr:unnamed protein product [Trifolium pratense]